MPLALGDPRACLRSIEVVTGDGAELVGHVQDDALGPLGAEAWNPGEGCDVLGGDGAPERVGGVDREHGQRQLGPDSLGTHERAEAVPLVGVGESEQRQRVLTDDQLGVNEGLLTHPETGQCGGRGLDAHTDAAGLDDGTGQTDAEDSAAQGRDHGQLLLDILSEPNGLRQAQTDIDELEQLFGS